MRQPNRELEKTLSRKRLRELLRYEPRTGDFIWLKATSNRVEKGALAGCAKDHNGARYILLGIDGRLYHAHRVAWFYMTGTWPQKELDHKDGNGWNNSWANLREATPAENQCNTKLRSDNLSGVKGITFYAGRKKPYRVWLNCRSLGSFATLAEAKAVRELAARESHGKFYRSK